MRVFIFSMFAVFMVSTLPNTSFAAEQRFVRDMVSVPVRTGQSNAYRIIHQGIQSGTAVTVLEDNSESNYSRIRLANGTEGWVETQYLQKQPTAAIRLREAQATIARLTDSEGSVGKQLLDLEQRYKETSSELADTQAKLEESESELAHIQSISSNAINLDRDNKQLLQELEALKHQRDTLNADNIRLNDELKRSEFINGAIAVILGIIATLVIQYFQSTRSRRRNEWA